MLLDSYVEPMWDPAYQNPTGCNQCSCSVVLSTLQIRNQLNQEQNSKLQQQKELLNKRNMEVAMMDKRINELRERLYGKKIQACESGRL